MAENLNNGELRRIILCRILALCKARLLYDGEMIFLILIRALYMVQNLAKIGIQEGLHPATNPKPTRFRFPCARVAFLDHQVTKSDTFDF